LNISLGGLTRFLKSGWLVSEIEPLIKRKEQNRYGLNGSNKRRCLGKFSNHNSNDSAKSLIVDEIAPILHPVPIVMFEYFYFLLIPVTCVGTNLA